MALGSSHNCISQAYQKKSASAQLRRWIKLNDKVLPILQSLGYKPGNRLLTPAHVKVIVDEFGEP